METKNIMNKDVPYIVHFSQEKTGSTTILEACKDVHIDCHRCYKDNIYEFYSPGIYTVTTVRNPVERAISQMFERNAKKDIPTLQQTVGEDLEWFDRYYLPVTGINVYDTAFDIEKGWQIYEATHLIIRLDRLTEVWAEAMASLMHGWYFKKPGHEAIGNIRFGEGYQALKDSLDLSLFYLTGVEKSKYYQHFWSKS